MYLVFDSRGISLPPVSIPQTESVTQGSNVSFLTFAFVAAVCPFVGSESGAVSSEARQEDERFIRAQGAGEEAE